MASPGYPFLDVEVTPPRRSISDEGFIECDEDTANQTVLKDVVAYVEVRSKAENRSRAVAKQLQLLGAKVVPKLTDEVTHVIWRDGKTCTRTKAIKKGLHLVSVSWIESCRQNKEHVAEDQFPVVVEDEGNDIFGTKKRRMKSMQPQTIEEDLKKMEARHDRRWKKKLAAFNAEIAGSPGTPTYNPDTYSPLIVAGQVFTPTRIIIPKTPPSMKERLNQLRDNKLGFSGGRPVVGESPVSSQKSHKQKSLFSLTFSDSSDSEDESLPEMMYESLSKKVNSLQRASKSRRLKVGPGKTPERNLLKLVMEGDEGKEFAGQRKEEGCTEAKHVSGDDPGGGSSRYGAVGLVSGATRPETLDLTPDVVSAQTRVDAKSKKSHPVVASDTGAMRSKGDTGTGSRTSRRRTVLSSDLAGKDTARSSCEEKRSQGVGGSRRKSHAGVSEGQSQGCAEDSPSETRDVGIQRKIRRRSIRIKSSKQETVVRGVEDDADSTAGIPDSKPGIESSSAISMPPAKRPRRSVAFTARNAVTEDDKSESGDRKTPSKSYEERRASNPGRRKSVTFKTDTRTETEKPDRVQNLTETAAKLTKERRKSESSLNPGNRQDVGNTVVPPKSKKRKLLPTNGPHILTEELIVPEEGGAKTTGSSGDHIQPKAKNPKSLRAGSLDSENNVKVRKKSRAKSLQLDREQTPKKQDSYDADDGKENEDVFRKEGAVGDDVSLSQGVVAEIRKSRKSIDEFNLLRKRKTSLQKRGSFNLSSDSESGSERDTKKRRTSTKERKQERFKSTIVMTSIPHSDQDLILSVVKKLKRYSVVDSVTQNTTHVICGGNRRTLNVLFGLARGCWIVSTEWILKSLEAGHWVEEEPYELHDYFPAAQICRLEKQALGLKNSYQQDIFSAVGSIYIAENTLPSQDKLTSLVTLCGGKVCTTLRTAKLCVGDIRTKEELPVVSEKWVLDCISQHTTLPFTDYYLLKDSS